MARQVFAIQPLPGREMCDFCGTSPTARLYACRNFVVPRTKHAVFQHESIGAWAACEPLRSPHRRGSLVTFNRPRSAEIREDLRSAA